MQKSKIFFLCLAGAVFLALSVFVYRETQAIYKEPSPQTSKLLSINLSDSGAGNVSWSVSGTPAAFKLVWSKNPSPVYPPRSGDKAVYHAGSVRSGKVDGFSGAGTYYVRVCEYINSGCGLYSNQIEVVLGASEQKSKKETTITPEKTVAAPKETVVVSGNETNKAFAYFEQLFNRLRGVELSLGQTTPSMVITPQGKITLVDALLTQKTNNVLTVEVLGLSFEINVSGASFEGGQGQINFGDLKVGDKLLIRGTVESGVIRASLVHDRSLRQESILNIRAQIDELLRRIEELKAKLLEI